MAHSVSECESKIKEYHQKLEEAARQIKWWTEESTIAHREEAERASHKKTA